MDERLALELTRDLWLWLAFNPDEDKGDWPGWAFRPKGEFSCPLCIYASYIASLPEGDWNRCDHCPLRSKWVSFTTESAPCTDEESPYTLWDQSEEYPVIRAAAALEIVKLCCTALEALPPAERPCRLCGGNLGTPYCPKCEGPTRAHSRSRGYKVAENRYYCPTCKEVFSVTWKERKDE